MIEDLVRLSHLYGKDPEFVLGGGGNTSWKDGETLYIKASGTSLGEITAEGFVKMGREKLAQIWNKDYGSDSRDREAFVLADLMASRCPGEEAKRPSVETLLHDLLPFGYVVHTHPPLVNGLTCGRDGESVLKRLFGPGVLWIPSVNPGYILSKVVKTAVERHRQEIGAVPELIFLQNHGIFVGSDQPAGIEAHYSRVLKTLEGQLKRKPDPSSSGQMALSLRDAFAELGAGPFVEPLVNREVLVFVSSPERFKTLLAPFTPDHIVYCGAEPAFSASPQKSELKMTFENFQKNKKRPPKIVAIQGQGIFAFGETAKAARVARDVFWDAVKIAVYSESFGGPLGMVQEQIDFIVNWEVESYRSKVSVGATL